jgi:hypothetical protein
VVRIAVELDDELALGPDGVDLVSVDEGVERRWRQVPGPAQRLERASSSLLVLVARGS